MRAQFLIGGRYLRSFNYETRGVLQNEGVLADDTDDDTYDTSIVLMLLLIQVKRLDREAVGGLFYTSGSYRRRTGVIDVR